jgi:protein SERAC1
VLHSTPVDSAFNTMSSLLKRRGKQASESRVSQPIYLAPPEAATNEGIELLHDFSDAIVDICFVHGLRGHRRSTWTAGNQKDPWPKTLLPDEVENVRILTFGYDASYVRLGPAGSNSVT